MSLPVGVQYILWRVLVGFRVFLFLVRFGLGLFPGAWPCVWALGPASWAGRFLGPMDLVHGLRLVVA